MPNGVLFSIRPEYVASILKGTKTVELRRKPLANNDVEFVLIYETAPTCAIVAVARLGQTLEGSPSRMWSQVSGIAGICRRGYRSYFDDVSTAFAFVLEDVAQLVSPIPLERLRAHWGWQGPPQSFRYVSVALRGEVVEISDAGKKVSCRGSKPLPLREMGR